MKIEWKITNEDIIKITGIINKYNSDSFVINRKNRNLKSETIILSNETIWQALIQSLLTTQEKSGPGSPVVNLISETPFPLNLLDIKANSDPQKYIYNVLKNHRVHYYNNKTDWIFTNYNLMTAEYVQDLTDTLNKLKNANSIEEERLVAHKVADDFKGIGPKQSRNFLQMQGLTKYVLPIDSRLTSWFNDNNLFPFKTDAGSLSSINFYEFIEDGIQELCKQANVYPCILDACIFVSFNKGEYLTDFN